MKLQNTLAATAALALLAGAANGQIATYSEDFEGFSVANADGLNGPGDDGWLVGANIFDSSNNFLFNYFAFPAPNFDGTGVESARFSNIQTGQGGVDQGANQLAIFSDYNNQGSQTDGSIIEANTFREYTVAAGDEGLWQFDFDYKNGDISQGGMTAVAFVKVLDPNANFSGPVLTFDTTNSNDLWAGGSIQVNIDNSQVGHIFQIGFWALGGGNDPSTVFYDNLNLFKVPTPGAVAVLGLGVLAGRRRRA
ncbi:MAG: hypothetical protein AAGB51_01280 [Planctomycetota bacterium]